MFDRLEAVWHVLTQRKVVVVTKGYTYTTGGANVYQDSKITRVEVKL